MESMHFVCDLTQRAIVAVGDTPLSLKVDPGSHTAELGFNRPIAPPLIAQGKSSVIESTHTSFVTDNLFRILELEDELRARVFAKLES